MKVLLVSPHFPPKFIGGVEIYTKRLADVLQSRGDRPVVLCVEESAATQEDVVEDTTYGYPVQRIYANLTANGQSLGMQHQSVDLLGVVGRVIDAARPDVVHLQSGYLLGGPTLQAARLRHIPTVVTLHEFWFICPRITMIHPSGELCSGPDSPEKCAWCITTEKRRARLPDRLTNGLLGGVAVPLLQTRVAAKLLRKSHLVNALTARRQCLTNDLSHADLILSPSRFLRDQVELAGFPADRIVISRLGIETKSLPPRPTAARLPLRIGYLGQIAPHKGVHLLVEAIRRLSSAQLVLRIYGDPTPHPTYTKRVQQLAQGDTRITLAGAYRHSDVYSILAELDLVVVPSVWYENSPLVIQEAQAAAVPVLASRLGGMRELVSDEHNGLLFEPMDVGALARQLERLLNDPTLLDRIRPDPSSVRTVEDEILELQDHYQRLHRSAPQQYESPQ